LPTFSTAISIVKRATAVTALDAMKQRKFRQEAEGLLGRLFREHWSALGMAILSAIKRPSDNSDAGLSQAPV